MLTKRLENIVCALPRCSVLADVGCDHGYIGTEALLRNIAQTVVFVDISAPSLQKARQNCPDELCRRAQFVCQDGLKDVLCDCAVIAGMGGLEIISVLKSARQLPQYLVLQPMRSQGDVRRCLTENYRISSDFKFFDGKFYDLIVAEKCLGGSRLSADEIAFGKTNLAHPSSDFLHFLHLQLDEYSQILSRCADAEVVTKRDSALRVLRQCEALAD